MFKVTSSTKIDKSGFEQLLKNAVSKSVDVGYINSPTHWKNDVPVAQIAATLHYDSAWNDTFMLSDTKESEVKSIVSFALNKVKDSLDLSKAAVIVGKDAVITIEENILGATSPANSKEWAAEKGFNDPLVHGSRIGQEPNLISELTYKVGN